MSAIRLFFATLLPAPLRQSLLAWRAQVEPLPGRATAPELWHLTWLFLGETHEEQLPFIQEAASKVLSQIEALTVTLDTLACWPHTRRPQVLVLLGASTSPSEALAHALSEALGRRLAKAFRPHLTLARFKRGEACPSLPAPPQPLVWPVTEVTLYRSELLPTGARHTALETWPLRSAAAG